MKQPTPDFRVTLNGRDLTSSIEPRLQSLSISECRAEEADMLDMVLNDSDGRLDIPKRGAVLSVSIGWADTGLVNKGTFTVDEVEHSGAPDIITVRARSASMTKSMGERQEKSWHDQTLGSIVRTIAGKHRLRPVITPALASIAIAHIDQTHESDMSFLTRLAKRYDAVMNVKEGNLLFMPIGQGRTFSGQPFKVLNITRKSGDQHRYHIAERENYEGVRAYYHSSGKAKREDVVVGGEDNKNIKVLPETYPTEAEARAAATAEFNRVQRGQATMNYTLALGIPEIFPELPVNVSGFKPEIDATAWLVKKVTHSLADAGLTTSLELEMRDDPTTDRHRSHFRKGGK
jgi:uncharacterized protein